MKPLNRFLLIDLVDEQEDKQESCVLVPDTYKPRSPYIKAKVLELAQDCKINVRKNQIVVVDRSMVQEIKINEKINFLILENYLVGVLEVPAK